jgi:hypothetical protein
MHEFEGMLFSDCDVFAKGLGRTDLANGFSKIRKKFASPEDINEKRIQLLVPNYQKPLHGNIAALELGIHKIRQECPNFRNWLDTLESLV